MIGAMWDSLVDTAQSYGVPEAVAFTIGSVLAHGLTFWISNNVLFYCYKHNLFPNARTFGSAMPEPELVNVCFKEIVRTHMTRPFAALFIMWPLFHYMGTRVYAPLPTAWEAVKIVFVSLLINDTGFYWMHRLLHQPPLYKLIHKKHHEFKVTIGIASEYAHPIEDIFANMLPTIAGPLLFGSHAALVWMWIAMRTWNGVEGHSGYEMPYSPFTWLAKLGGSGADAHAFHHMNTTGCYGATFKMWDKLCGTDREYLKWKEQRTANGGGPVEVTWITKGKRRVPACAKDD